MKLKDCLEIGQSCELNTVGEAILNIQWHAISLFNYGDVARQLTELENDFLASGIKEDTAIEKALNKMKNCWVEEAGFSAYQCRDGKTCHHDAGIRWEDSNSGAVGPCGQQHCWFGCFVCRYNHQQTCEIEEEDLQ